MSKHRGLHLHNPVRSVVGASPDTRAIRCRANPPHTSKDNVLMWGGPTLVPVGSALLSKTPARPWCACMGRILWVRKWPRCRATMARANTSDNSSQRQLAAAEPRRRWRGSAAPGFGASAAASPRFLCSCCMAKESRRWQAEGHVWTHWPTMINI